MSTQRLKTTFSCWNDCRMEGCPTHTLEVESGNTCDYASFYLDGERADFCSYYLSNACGIAAVFALLQKLDGFINVSGHKEEIEYVNTKE